MREWKFYITGSIYADTLGETTADIEDAKAIGRCFVIKSNGNAAKMREALNAIIYTLNELNTNGEMEYWQYSVLFDIADKALSAPPRNCDVGTIEEQLDRYGLFCQNKCPTCENRFSCHICGERYRMKCMVAWAQMPYEKGGEK